MRRLSLLAPLVIAACTSHGPPGPHPIGAEAFTSAAPRTGGTGGEVGGVATPGTPPVAGQDRAAGAAREVTEADLYVRAGAMLYVQNAWRGLQVVDLSDPASPRLRGTVPLTGTPVGLYLAGTTALVVSSDHLSWLAAADGGPARPSVGARLWAVDVSDPDAPVVRAELPVEGELTDTRRVGDVLYLVTRSLPPWIVMGPPVPGGGSGRGGVGVGVAAPETAPDDTTTVASFDVSEPAAPRAVDALTFPHGGWSIHVNVTAERVTVGRAGWDAANGPLTHLTAIDIRDPAGALSMGAEVTVAGTLQDRWGLDLDAATGTLRAVVADGWTSGSRLHVLAWAAPGKVEPLAALDLDVPERLTAARFDGARVYVVTALAIDPLWVVDLADPARPALAGRLELPGQLDFIVPRGDRLLALGHGGGDPGTFQLHVSLLDVADPAAPALVARETLAPDWAFVPASSDDLHKAFQVLDAEGLLLVPFQGYDRGAWRWVGGTQLLTFSRDALVREGFVPHRGDLRRAFATATPGVVAALSDERLQTIDATDRAAPVELAALDLARPVWQLAVAGARAVEVSGWPWSGSGEWVVVPASDPNAASPSWRAPLDASGARLFRTGDVAWLAATEPVAGGTFVQALDLAPGTPRLRGRLDVPAAAGGSWWWGPPAVQAGRALVIARFSGGGPVAGGAPAPAGGGTSSDLVVVDLADADAPRLVVVPVPPAAWLGELRAEGTSAWLSQYDWVDPGAGTVRFTAVRVDLSDPAAPVVAPPVNVPGRLFSASPDGARLYTEEQVWDGAEGTTWIHTLERTSPGTARLVASTKLPGWYWGAVRAGGFAYVTGWAQDGARLAAVDLGSGKVTSVQALETSGAGILGAAGSTLLLSTWWPASAVLVMELADPGKPALVRTVRTQGGLQELVVEGGVAYLPAGPYGVARIPLAE
jgi:hypothetical protein